MHDSKLVSALPDSDLAELLACIANAQVTAALAQALTAITRQEAAILVKESVLVYRIGTVQPETREAILQKLLDTSFPS